MYRQWEKNLLSTNTSSTCPVNMVNSGPLTAEIGSGVWGPLHISTGFASWQRFCTASSSGRQPNFAALNRGRHLCLAGRPSGWALAHILVLLFITPKHQYNTHNEILCNAPPPSVRLFYLFVSLADTHIHTNRQTASYAVTLHT